MTDEAWKGIWLLALCWTPPLIVGMSFGVWLCRGGPRQLWHVIKNSIRWMVER